MDRGSSITPWDLECMLCDETAEPKALPLSLLEHITDGFSDEQQIGSGGFAIVYKGKLENRIVAVKRMFNTYMYEKEFQREVECLMMVKHKNVVRFLGYCADTQGNMARHNGKFIMADVQQRLLCFEYLPNGSLLEYITDTASGLHWGHRYKIINGICHGLHYLHQHNIVHLDLKPGNILLDANLVAKIADFGLSRCFDDMQSRVITVKIGGTLGYLAPEFGNGEITYQFDIYSLGVIIMEILTGKKGFHAVDKVVQSWSNTLEKSQIDVQLKQVRVCAEIGIECINPDPAKRPDAQHIIDRLDETECVDEYIETCVISSQQAKNAPNELHQDTCIALGESSSKAKENNSLLEQAKNATNELHQDTPILLGESSSKAKENNSLFEQAKNALNELHQDTPITLGESSSKETHTAKRSKQQVVDIHKDTSFWGRFTLLNVTDSPAKDLRNIKNIRIYTKKQLKKMTKNYRSVIGDGHFGRVYSGIDLKDKNQVAVKRTFKIDKVNKKDFTNEVIIQSGMRHKNIVRLLGCCLEMEAPMLVYEFVQNGSLYDFLFKNRDSIPVDTRLRIAIGSAEGLTYTHSSLESTILHGDVKSGNILLDKNFNPKISDFGTSKLLAKGKSENTEMVIWDMCYIDPIYMERGVLTQKSDVYSFGIVLIELITRRPARYDDKRSYVANFVQACHDNRPRNFVDNDITSEEDIKLLEMVSEVVLECLELDPEERPDMKQVEHRLHVIGQSAQLGQQSNY